MNKFAKDGLTICLIGVVALGGYIGYKAYKVNEVINQTIADIDELNKEIPHPLVASHKLTKGAFKSTGLYSIKVEKEGELLELKFNYTVNHGIKDLFTGTYPILGSIDVYDTQGVLKKIGIESNLVNVTGNFYKNGSFDLKGLSKSMDISRFAGVKLAPITIGYEYDNDTKYAKVTTYFPMIKQVNGTEIKNAKIILNTSVKNILTKTGLTEINSKTTNYENILVGKGSIEIESVTSNYANIKNITAKYFSEKNGSKYNSGVTLNIGEAKTIITDSKSITGGFDININDVDGDFMLQYYKLMKDRKFKKLTKENLDVAKLFKNGFSINLNKLNYSDGTNSLEGNAQIKFIEQDINKPINLRENTLVAINLDGKGEMVEMVKSFAAHEYFEGQPEGKANVKILFNKNRMVINNKQALPEDTENLTSILDDTSRKINEME